MRIHEFIWTQDRVDHVARHRVRPEEVEEVCFGEAWVRRAKASGKNPVYYVLGQTESERYLFCVLIQFPNGKGVPCDSPANDGERETAIQPMEKAMKVRKMPQTDSIEELAQFWETHDLTEFEDQLEEVSEPVFERKSGTGVTVRLRPQEAQAVKRVAKARGIRQETLLRRWVLEKLQSGKVSARRR